MGAVEIYVMYVAEIIMGAIIVQCLDFWPFTSFSLILETMTV